MGTLSGLGQVSPQLLRYVRLVECDIVQADDRVHGRPDLMAHVAQEGSLGLAGLFRCGQGFAQGLLLRQGLPGLGIHVREARAHTVHQMVRPVFRMTHAREAHGLPGFLSVHADHVSIGNHQVFFQSLPDMVRLDKLQEVLPVWFQDIFVTVCGHRLQIVESLSRPEAVQVSPCLVAHTPVLIQFQIVHAPVVGCQCRNQLALFLLLGLLRQQLILKGQSLFHLLVPCPVFRIGGFFFQLQLRILPDLADDEREQARQCQCCQQGLNQAAGDDPVRNGADPVADHFLTDQIGQEPVRVLHGHIAEHFPRAVVVE